MRVPVPNPDHLFEQADRLVAPSGRGEPRQADLRRAISNAYYGLFHAIATETADDFVGRTQRHTARYSLLYRSIGHRSLLRLCEDIRKPTLRTKYSEYQPAGDFGADLKIVANAVIELQERRHLADYDPRFRAATSDAAQAIDTARTALLRFRTANRASRRMFLSLLLFPPR